MSGHSIMGGAYFQIVVSQNSSIQSRCVIWDPFSSDLGSICDTICLQTRVSLDPKTQCGWQSTEKKAERISFTHKNTTTTTSTTIYFLEVCIIRTVATLQKNIKTCFCLRERVSDKSNDFFGFFLFYLHVSKSMNLYLMLELL